MLRNKRFKKTLILLLIVSLIIGIIVIKPSMADYDYALTDAEVELVMVDDEMTDGEVTVEFQVPQAGIYYHINGDISIHETTEDGEAGETHYFTLQSTEMVEVPVSKTSYQTLQDFGDANNKRIYYQDANMDGSTGLNVAEDGDTVWTMTYKVDKDTPAGTYYVALSTINVLGYDISGEEIEWDEPDVVLVSEIEVTRESSEEKDEIEIDVLDLEDSYEYTGSAIKPEITVINFFDEEEVLVKGVDYTLTYGENINVGEEAGEITIKPVATSAYTFEEIMYIFEITPYEIQDTDVSLSYTTIGANGAERKPGVSVMFNGEEVSLSNFDLTYANNTAVSTRRK